MYAAAAMIDVDRVCKHCRASSSSSLVVGRCVWHSVTPANPVVIGRRAGRVAAAADDNQCARQAGGRGRTRAWVSKDVSG